jgi:hypothetical protein
MIVLVWIDDHHHQLQKYGANIKEFNFDEFFKSAFEPKISDDKEKGGKKIDLSMDMTGFRPNQIQIHLKDHDLIVQVNIRLIIAFSKLFFINSRLNQAHQINSIQLVHIFTNLLHYHLWVNILIMRYHYWNCIISRMLMLNICAHFFMMVNDLWLLLHIMKILLI